MTSPALSVAIEAARLGARELIKFRGQFSVQEKAPRDLVTDADLASQKAIFAHLREHFPDHAMVGEEEGHDEPPRNPDGSYNENQVCWVVDPLDGTVNYVHRLQSFCVSIALVHRGVPSIGVILDPIANELFVAEKQFGARVSAIDGSNATKIGVSACESLSQALLACSFPAGVRKEAPEVREFCEVLEASRAVRRLGSCALNLCYVAAGRLDGYWASSVKAWDMAAGMAILQEAGGTITSKQGEPVDLWKPRFAAAATSTLHRALLETLGKGSA